MTYHVSLKQAIAQLKESDKPFTLLMEHGTMQAEYYAPFKEDYKMAQTQDEVYIIASGSGTFFNNGERTPFRPGDVIFVPAGVEHCFENFSHDFATWIIFYGPKGGEK